VVPDGTGNTVANGENRVPPGSGGIAPGDVPVLTPYIGTNSGPTNYAPAFTATVPQGSAAAAPPVADYARIVQEQNSFQMEKTPLSASKALDLQTGKTGVDYAVQLNNMRNMNQAANIASRQAAGRNCLQVHGVWIDDGFNATMKTVTVKAQSPAYFRILEKYPQVKEVFQLGNQVVWVTPSNCALVIDCNNGKEKMSDLEIDRLFVARK
jgi:hypothetical protein